MAGEWMLKGWNRTQKNQANWNQKKFSSSLMLRQNKSNDMSLAIIYSLVKYLRMGLDHIQVECFTQLVLLKMLD
jgi:hypothetical protein